MNTHVPKSMHMPKSVNVPLAIAGLAILLLATMGMAVEPVTSWFQDSFEGSAGTLTEQLPVEESSASFSTPPPAEPRGRARCEECGIIESMRRVAPAGNAPAVYEITVRLADRSTRVLSDPSPANWRPGERIILIGGGSQPRR